MDAALPTEIPEPPDLQEILGRANGWVPTRTQMALMLVASFSGYVHWPAFYLLLLGLAWISLEIERRIALGVGLRWDLSYWTSVVWTTILFLLAPFEVGRLLSLMVGYLQG
jgi:hypothetical protein